MEEKAKFDKDMEPYLAELKKAEEQKSAALWKKVEANAKLSKGVPADKREFETIFAHLDKGEAVTKKQREGYNLWSDVDKMRGKKRSDFLKEHSLEG